MKIELRLGGVPKKIRKIAQNEKVGLFLATTCARYMDEFVPMRTGALKDSARTNIPFQVTYETPYARRIYYGEGITIHGDQHPNATSHWDKAMEESHKNQIAVEVTNFVKRL